MPRTISIPVCSDIMDLRELDTRLHEAKAQENHHYVLWAQQTDETEDEIEKKEN